MRALTCRLAFLFLSLSLSLTLSLTSRYSIPDINRREENRTAEILSVQFVDFTFTSLCAMFVGLDL